VKRVNLCANVVKHKVVLLCEGSRMMSKLGSDWSTPEYDPYKNGLLNDRLEM
jgi:hypothetical protein